MEKSSFLITVEKSTALLMEIDVIRMAVWHLGMGDMTSLRYITSPLICRSNRTDALCNVLRSFELRDLEMMDGPFLSMSAACSDNGLPVVMEFSKRLSESM
jgi:hypothetical protein